MKRLPWNARLIIWIGPIDSDRRRLGPPGWSKLGCSRSLIDANDRRLDIRVSHQAPGARAGFAPAAATPPGRAGKPPCGKMRAMRIRAAVLEEFGQPLVVQEVELAEPKAGEVLVRLTACGVCHTDLYTASGADPTGYAPCVLGHEGAGVVERVGDGVTLVRPGDHVITLFAPECGKCVHCLSPRTNRCIAIRDRQNDGYLPDGTTRLARDGEPLRHFMGCSTFAEYTVMPEIALAKVEPRGARPRAARRSRAASRPASARPSTRPAVEPGSTVAVFGCGLVGLGAVIGARLAGAGADRRVRPLRAAPRRGAPPRRDRHARSPATTRSTGSAARPAASAPTTPSRRPATSP